MDSSVLNKKKKKKRNIACLTEVNEYLVHVNLVLPELFQYLLDCEKLIGCGSPRPETSLLLSDDIFCKWFDSTS